MESEKEKMSPRPDEDRSDSEEGDTRAESDRTSDERKQGQRSEETEAGEEAQPTLKKDSAADAKRPSDDRDEKADAPVKPKERKAAEAVEEPSITREKADERRSSARGDDEESAEEDEERDRKARRRTRVTLPDRPPHKAAETHDEPEEIAQRSTRETTAERDERPPREARETAKPAAAASEAENANVPLNREPSRARKQPEVSRLVDDPEDDEEEGITGRERTLRAVVLAVLLIAATVFAYQKAWNAGYIWDDDIYVTSNELLTAPDGLKRIWLSLDSPSQYFPLVYTSFRIEHALWGLNASGYHWVNIAFHVANALLLWRLLSVLAIPGAWLGAALFALHPVHVESVAWISERKNVLMGFFFLLALLAWHKFVAGKHRGSIPFYLLALLCFALALASKTTACMLPVALLLISWLKRGAISLARVIQVLPFVILGVGMGLVTIWWERYRQGTQGELFAIGIIDRILIAARGFWFYLTKLAWPADLAFSYPRFNISAGDPADYLWLAACIVLAIAVWVARRWIGRGPEVALTFFFAMLAPTLGFVMLYTFRYTFVADHYAYLASIGPLALVAAAISTALNPLGRMKPFLLPVLCAALLIPLGLRTWRQGGVYQNEETLWRATLAVNPGSWMAHNNLAIQLLNRDQLDEAVQHFEEALRLDPNYAEAHFNLGNASFRLRRAADARRHYERALELNPRIAVAHTNLGILLLELGDTEKGIKHLEEAVKIEPRAVVAQQRLSEALVRQGRSEEAVQHFEAAAKVDPSSSSVDADNLIAVALLRQGKTVEAVEQAKRTLEANPNSTTAFTNYGIILAELRQVDEAVAQFGKALQLDPSNAEAHYNLGNTLLMRRDVSEAMKHYQRAVELRPNYAAAHLNLGNTLAESGRSEEAIAEYRKALEIRPDYANAHTNLATALNRLGRFDEAMTHLQAAWKLEAQARSASPTPTP